MSAMTKNCFKWLLVDIIMTSDRMDLAAPRTTLLLSRFTHYASWAVQGIIEEFKYHMRKAVERPLHSSEGNIRAGQVSLLPRP